MEDVKPKTEKTVYWLLKYSFFFLFVCIVLFHTAVHSICLEGTVMLLVGQYNSC